MFSQSEIEKSLLTTEISKTENIVVECNHVSSHET